MMSKLLNHTAGAVMSIMSTDFCYRLGFFLCMASDWQRVWSIGLETVIVGALGQGCS